VSWVQSPGFHKVLVSCTTLPRLLLGFGWQSQQNNLFIKIDTEGAERLIVPALYTWMQSMKVLPTIYLSMHDTANEHERGLIARVLNLYPYYAIMPGRTREPRASVMRNSRGIDTGACKSGVPLTRNEHQNRFSPHTVCSWCDYLLVPSNIHDRCPR
jgi:hypothetical protein